ncbi:MAG: hypothetical protein IMW98_10460 [Firmicutes bacterium]|nr:hypothetical protein [Bacillota bacterium]
MTYIRPLLEPGTFEHVRALAAEGRVLAQVGDRVHPDDVVAEVELVAGAPYFIDVRRELGLPAWDPERHADALLVRVGDRIRAHDPIARVELGRLREVRWAKSPVGGVVEWVSLTAGQLIVREDAQSASPVEVVDVAGRLKLPPSVALRLLRYREGDDVQAGAVLAAEASYLSRDVVYAPADGCIERIDPQTGVVYIVRPSTLSRLAAGYPGEVVAAAASSVTVRTSGWRLWGVLGRGPLRWGPLRPLEEGEPVTAAHEGCVVAVRGELTATMWEAARRHRVAAVVAASAAPEAWPPEPARSAGERSPALMLTEGAAGGAMLDEVWTALERSADRLATVNPVAHVRAGALPPAMVVAAPEAAPAEPLYAVKGDAEEGEPVRVVAGRHAGRRGRFRGWTAPRRLPSGVLSEAARIELDGGEAEVARENFETLRRRAG